MPRYEIIIYWSQADEAFIAEVPELPGCAADGKTYKEALANVEVIIQEWIETAKELGRPIPAPRGSASTNSRKPLPLSKKNPTRKTDVWATRPAQFENLPDLH